LYLAECTRPVTALRGVGPVLAGRLERLGIRTLADLLRYAPRDYQDRRRRDTLAEAGSRERANVLVRVVSGQWFGRKPPRIFKAEVEDETGRAALLCFGRPFLAKVLLPGRRFRVSGRFQRRGGELTCGGFELEAFDPREESRIAGRILPVYPLTEGVSQRALRGLTAQALEAVGAKAGELAGRRPTSLSGFAPAGMPAEVPEGLRARHGLPGLREALRGLHFPRSEEEQAAARRALAYAELFYYQLQLDRSRRDRQTVARRRERHAQGLKARLLERLPFRLTGDQERALAEIEADLFAPHPSSRLLQGEVGSGKTLVALLAALAVIEAGEQAALLAPTELLARQHADTAARLLEPLGVRVAFLTGGVTGEPRARLLEALAGGGADLVVGTHALYTEEVRYRRLGLAIVDEQQRFGVRQRGALLGKGRAPDLLMMSATPIPRSLALVLFGDLGLSELREMPPGRLPVVTHLTRQGNEGRVYERVREEVRRGGQAYFVYPLIGEEAGPAAGAAEGMYRRLKREVFPELRLALLHSRLPEERKIRAMAEFAAGRLDILVATSVMEVGVDVPNASCIVIEQAERFGLASLHQLRGRVGRGPRRSYAFLVYGEGLSEAAAARLKAVLASADGFALAEEDLRLRGPGEFLGPRQSGALRLGVAELARDWDICLAARADALELAAADPGLDRPENGLVREVLERLAGGAGSAGREAGEHADHGWIL
jgi:ATP-dependent DNA helicase RecG